MKKNLFRNLTIGLMAVSPALLMGVSSLGTITANAAAWESSNPEASVKCMTIYGSKEPIYTAQGVFTGKYLPVGTSWRLGKSIAISGKYYFEVATNEYITGQTADYPYTPYDGTVRVISSTTPAPIYTRDGAKITGRALAPGSYWHTDREVNLAGISYFRVATDEYVCVSDAAPV
ncbi:SLAP domain-containing protein [Companilactobacillus jidongensis]|uniref:SLAP domain-containing protein n=1 Tax=Companilactobacillus jidongensis TaxID=2486006 RepID=UPI000F781893|nr:SLAP domain-containing protein [Companilactobacillus jidongensis]